MSGATGAGPAKTGANGARGPAADSQGGQGATVTDTRGPEPESAPAAQPQAKAKAKANGKQKDGAGQERGAQPYQPPQAYAAPKGPGAQRGPSPVARTTPRTRKARLRVAKADPWSVMKVSFLLSIALGVCTVVAAAVLWMVMDAMGIFSTVGGTISEATGSNEGNGFDLQSFLSLPRVLIFTSVIAVIDVVLMTALATLGSFIYNLSAGFVGGVELTLAEDE
ncbi:DUF3566 domain-containing protein [Streptomyces lavendulae]|uniref:Uncharacterized protein n=1 Tax=Streptomyces lavendulae subsp. lavendulae TaxID=58340 RepID=A0A2K8PG46_STRLA|nr:DUF3566 domain-containing protein [Streptomyces lavendulae]ATZ25679.1 hypothetical protein SLAV_19260 [Streptomyces lavendulae subsp. lavendulae]QUQ55507.1 hypothetical protein SLLC_17360 [Streptomyces lavendulae subsp. lavendulae]